MKPYKKLCLLHAYRETSFRGGDIPKKKIIIMFCNVDYSGPTDLYFDFYFLLLITIYFIFYH